MDDEQKNFSDYIVFIDESGSPTLSPVDPNHPIFVLVFCVVNKWHYADVIQPAMKRLKFDFFGHDMAVLHSSDIRKTKGDFLFLLNPKRRALFLQRLDEIMAIADLNIIAHIIDKRMPFDYSHPRNDPYLIGLRMCLHRLRIFLASKGQSKQLTHLIAESRGRREDRWLMDEFMQVQAEVRAFDSTRDIFRFTPLELLFTEKKANSTGLQLADLTCHPIGRNYLKPDQHNHAFDIVRTKIFGQIGRSP